MTGFGIFPLLIKPFLMNVRIRIVVAVIRGVGALACMVTRF